MPSFVPTFPGWCRAGRPPSIFGFNVLAGRLSAALGPMLFGILPSATGGQRIALLSLLVLLLAVGVVLTWERTEEG
jgi:MFS-type transporter involved in bile tolerance (Atg22 family)